MTREVTVRPLRCAMVWLAVTAATTLSVWFAQRELRPLLFDHPLPPGFAELLVLFCTAVLPLGAAWLWVITTATVIDLLRGAEGPASAEHVRRWVLVMCGAALGAGVVAPPATAQDTHPLAGLPLPDRAAVAPATEGPPVVAVAAPTRAHAGPQHGHVHVVRRGESLWSITAHLGGDPGREWRRLWHHNQDAIGSNPHLIHPGLRLHVPEQIPSGSTHENRSHP